MSEEEIMQGINKTIRFMKEELKADHSCFTIQELWAVNGLLDLYQKEKEKNKELEKKLANRIELLDYMISKDYISKDKIKAKIHAFKEIKKEILSCENKLAKASITYDIVRNDYCEKMLKDLLEEE